jgi:hypothetical protein
MVKQFSKLILSLIVISGIFCSFGFGEPFAFSTQSNHQQVEASIDSHLDGFSGIIVGVHRDPLNPHFISFPGEEWKPEEEYAKKMSVSLQGYYSTWRQLAHHVNALFRPALLSAFHLYHHLLYLLFEVFLC